MDSSTVVSITPAEVADAVLKAFERAECPLTLPQLQRRLPRPYQRRMDDVRQAVNDYLAQGRLHQFAPYKTKGPRFWNRPLEDLARAVIVQVLGTQALTQRELLLKVQARLQGLEADRVCEVLGQMVDEGQVRKLPPRPGGRNNLLGSGTPQPRDYLAPVFRAFTRSLDRVLLRLESEGVSREDALRVAENLWRDTAARVRMSPVPSGATEQEPLPQTPEMSEMPEREEQGEPYAEQPQAEQQEAPWAEGQGPRAAAPQPAASPEPAPPALEPGAGQAVMEAAIRLHPGSPPGTVVSVRELRQALQDRFADRQVIDRAILRAAEEGRVELHPHHHGAGGEQQPSEDLVVDGHGGAYDGVVLKP
jgi:hypothetical protein